MASHTKPPGAARSTVSKTFNRDLFNPKTPSQQKTEEQKSRSNSAGQKRTGDGGAGNITRINASSRTAPTSSSEAVSYSNMLERSFNVHQRAAPPPKRAKLDEKQEQPRASFQSAGGVMGPLVNTEEEQHLLRPNKAAVDLTLGKFAMR
jgi:hypothetical protein